jgi:Ca2+-binding EF-hand superfamily protein
MPSDSFEGIPETVSIKSGDTLGKLVAKYQITYDKLKELNPEIFQEGQDAKGRKRSGDGHWIYPGDVIRLRTASATPPATPPATASDTPTPTVTLSANGRVVEAAKAAIDEAKLFPATTANGRELSQQAVSQAQEMLKLIPASDPARAQYASKVSKLEQDFQAAYPAATATAQGRFDDASDRFNQAVQSYYDAASQPAAKRTIAQGEARDLAIRYFSAAHDASRELSGNDAKAEAHERLEMMEFALTDMGVNASSLALARGEGEGTAPAATPATFAERDLNQDGYLSGNELDEKAKAFDADGNQRVTRAEWEEGHMAAREAEWKREFEQADLNQDGWLSGSETSKYAAYDANGDMEITVEEVLNAKRAEVMNGVHDEDFKARDKNQDGYLSGNELDAATRAFDTNMDGKVTREEYMAAKTGAPPAAAGVPVDAAVPQPTIPATPAQGFEAASQRFNEAAGRNDLLAMTTAYQDAAFAIAYMPVSTERDTLAAQLEVMGFTLQQAYATQGQPVAAGGVAAGGTATGLTAQPINAGVPVPGDATYQAAVQMPQLAGTTLQPSIQVPPAIYPAGTEQQATMAYQAALQAAQAGTTYQPAVMMPAAAATTYQPTVMMPQTGYPAGAAPVAAAAQPEAIQIPQPARQTYTQVWSTPEYLNEAMGYNQQAANGSNGNMSAQGNGTSGTTDAQGNSNTSTPAVNEQAVREIDTFLQQANADAVRDMLASRPELLYDSQPGQKATMLRLLIEGRTDAGDRAAIVKILDMAAQTEQVDTMLNALDSQYGGAGKGFKRMLEDLDKASKAAALKAMFTPSLMQNRKYDPAAFDAAVSGMTKDDLKVLMESMGYGVSAPWMNVFAPQTLQAMITKLKSGFSLFGGSDEKQMIAALERATVNYTS